MRGMRVELAGRSGEVVEAMGAAGAAVTCSCPVRAYCKGDRKIAIMVPVILPG